MLHTLVKPYTELIWSEKWQKLTTKKLLVSKSKELEEEEVVLVYTSTPTARFQK